MGLLSGYFLGFYITESLYMRRVAFIHSSIGHSAKVYRDSEWQEYRVKFYDPEGNHYPEADYHTTDLDDATSTARGQLERFKLQD